MHAQHAVLEFRHHLVSRDPGREREVADKAPVFAFDAMVALVLLLFLPTPSSKDWPSA
jgi:hypothetical protein